MAFDPRLRAFYVAAVHHPTVYYTRPLEPTSRSPWSSYTFTKPVAERSGTLTAISSDNGDIRWQRGTELPLVGGVLSTAGELVFTGSGRGALLAYDARSGERLWRFATDYGVNAPPVSYAVNDRQYIAVAAGGNSLFRFPTGDAILAFRLKEK